MELFSFFDTENKEKWIFEIEKQDWGAAKFLSELLKENRFKETLGEGGLYIMHDGEKLVSFATLTQKDAIDDEALSPWVGFLFVAPEYRGKRVSERLIAKLCGIAHGQGYKKIYICTDHIGLYEKFGFTYMENRIDVWGEDSRIYYKDI